MRKIISTIIIGHCLVACSPMPPKPTLRTMVPTSVQETTDLLFKRGDECWRIYVEAGRGQKSQVYGIEIAWPASKHARILVRNMMMGVVRPPILIVDIREDIGGSDVTVKEGEASIDHYEDFSADIARWLRGDLSC